MSVTIRVPPVFRTMTSGSAQVDVEYDVLHHTEAFRDPPRRFQFGRVPLTIPKRQRIDRVAVVPSDRECRRRIKPAAEQHHCRPLFHGYALPQRFQ